MEDNDAIMKDYEEKIYQKMPWPENLLGYILGTESVTLKCSREEADMKVREILNTLSDSVSTAILYDFFAVRSSLEDISDKYKTNVLKIQQIIDFAARELKHPSRSKLLYAVVNR